MSDITILSILFLIIVALIFSIYRTTNKCGNYDDYLTALSFKTGKSQKELFRIAADVTGINLSNNKVNQDYLSYSLNGDEIPHYVKKFLDEGKEWIDEKGK